MRNRLVLALVALAGLPAALRADPTRAERREVAAAVAGFDAEGLARVDSLLQQAIDEGATPGAALVIGRAGRLVRLRGYGHTDWNPFSPAVTDSTIYDLASLTKAIGTNTVALMLVREGKLSLDDRLADRLSFWPRKGRYGDIRIRHLLQHTSGLPAGVALWTEGGTRHQRLAELARLPITTKPGSRREYSDVGMILLGAVLEEVSGMTIDRLIEQRVLAPLGTQETGFNPLRSFALDRIAPTERDSRTGMLLQGSVHDGNAAALSGVAGHAGMFGSARDLARFSAAILDAAQQRENDLFSDNTFALALDDRAFGRPLGWDAPVGRSSSGHFFSSESFGHTGFTGTSIWIDPRQDLFVVLLTNRLNPTAANQKHIALRRELHDAVQLAISAPAPAAVPLEMPAEEPPFPVLPIRVVSTQDLERRLMGEDSFLFMLAICPWWRRRRSPPAS